MNHNTPLPSTLEELHSLKVQALQDVHQQKEVVEAMTRKLLTPFTPSANKTPPVMKAFNTGMAIFDGAMLGIKIIRKLQRAFKFSK